MFGRDKNKASKSTTVIHKTGWTGDADTEGLFEENFLVAIIVGVSLLVIAMIGHFVGVSVDLNWFEGQNLISTMGIIFLIVFIPAIAISTFTGKSDLVKWEALFLLIAVGMILIGNGFNFSDALESFTASIAALGNMQVNQLLMAFVVIIGIAIAIAVGTGQRVSGGAAVVIIILLAAIGIMNLWTSGTFDNIGSTIQNDGWAFFFGKVLSDFTGGLAAGHAGAAIGIGCVIIGLVLVLIPNFSTPIGVLLLIIGAGITGLSAWDYIGVLFGDLRGENGPAAQQTTGLAFIGFPAGGIIGYILLRRFLRGG